MVPEIWQQQPVQIKNHQRYLGRLTRNVATLKKRGQGSRFFYARRFYVYKTHGKRYIRSGAKMELLAKKMDDINRTLKQMLEVMDKPESKFNRFFERIVLIVGAMGIVSAADIIRQWVMDR
jgi:flagellar motor component MotA